MTKADTAILKYREYMTEIRSRTDVINGAISKLHSGDSLTGYRESDIELIYLQFRHCLELIMFASLSAHYAHGYDLSQRLLRKEYNATRLLRFLKAKNAHFYPRPVESGDIKGEDGIWRATPLTEGFLTQDDFCSLYDKSCGKLLHAQRTSKFKGVHEELIQDATFYRDRMMKLLNCHWVTLTEDISFRVIMRDAETGAVGINVMKLVGTKI